MNIKSKHCFCPEDKCTFLIKDLTTTNQMIYGLANKGQDLGTQLNKVKCHFTFISNGIFIKKTATFYLHI